MLCSWFARIGCFRKDGRVVEGASLLTRQAVKRFGGSNPSPSAIGKLPP